MSDGSSSRTDDNWRHWASTDPYYAVLTTEDFRSASIRDSRASFFETGQRHIEWLLDAVGLPESEALRMNALDYGCGVGRLTIPLARRFKSVTGADVAPAMLEEARSNCSSMNIPNADFVLVPSSGDLPKRTYSLIHSLYVFQHIPEERGLSILANLARQLEIDGTLAVHLTTRRNFSVTSSLTYHARNSLPFGNLLYHVLKGRTKVERAMLATEYDIPRVLSVLSRNGCEAYSIISSDDGPISSVILSCRRGTHRSHLSCPSFPDPAGDRPVSAGG